MRMGLQWCVVWVCEVSEVCSTVYTRVDLVGGVRERPARARHANGAILTLYSVTHARITRARARARSPPIQPPATS
ncbi:hypothetical protein C2E23DRAFT_812937 [Lenzites betulinus]|nr:hypothetical protein C2E23DRAFT_812937 [Lenzites betulinus]